MGLGDQDLCVQLPLLVGSFNRGLVRVLTVDLGIVKLALLEETSAPIVIDPSRLGAGFYCLQTIRVNLDRLLIVAILYVCFLKHVFDIVH